MVKSILLFLKKEMGKLLILLSCKKPAPVDKATKQIFEQLLVGLLFPYVRESFTLGKRLN